MKVTQLKPRRDGFRLWRILMMIHYEYDIGRLWPDQWAATEPRFVDVLVNRMIQYPAVFSVGEYGLVFVTPKNVIHAAVVSMSKEDRNPAVRKAAWDEIVDRLRELELWPVHCYLNDSAMMRVAKRYGFEVDNG